MGSGRMMTMAAKWKEGDRVRIVTRELAPQDRLNSVFPHMLGLTGVVENVYNANEISVKVDLDQLQGVAKDAHKESTRRMREKFAENVPEQDKKSLTSEEMNFTPNYVLLVRETDLEKA